SRLLRFMDLLLLWVLELDRITHLPGLQADPPELGEGIDPRLATEAAIAGRLHAAERHLRLVLDGRAVDVADAAFEPLRHPERSGRVAAEHRGRETVLAVVRDRDG